MSVAAHLGIRISEYDRLIRTFIPRYEAMLEAAGDTVAAACRATGNRTPAILDLGIGTGALSAQCLAVLPGARIIGIDEDDEIAELAHKRLGRRLTTVSGTFSAVPLPRADAIVASLALHHLSSSRRKAALYVKAYRALRPGGVMVNADCALSSSAALQRRDRDAWVRHLRRSYSSARAASLLRAWGREDTYFRLEDEVRWMRAAGFHVDIVWRRGSFAVIAGFKR